MWLDTYPSVIRQYTWSAGAYIHYWMCGSVLIWLEPGIVIEAHIFVFVVRSVIAIR